LILKKSPTAAGGNATLIRKTFSVVKVEKEQPAVKKQRRLETPLIFLLVVFRPEFGAAFVHFRWRL
jgi:hypothetical protein